MLVVLGFNDSLRQYFSLNVISRQRGRKREKKEGMIEKKKMSKQPPLAFTAFANTVCLCPAIIQISRMLGH